MPPKRVRTVEGTCWQCKDRRVLCDLGKPECGRCESTGQKCDYNEVKLRWAGGVASRGRYSGQKLPIADPKRDLSLTGHHNDWQLLYFNREILTRFSMLDEGLGIDCDYFTGDSALHQAVNAVASAHRISRGRITTSEALQTSRQARFNAIKALRMNLATTSLEEDAVFNQFSSSVLLCILDGMIEPRDDDAATLYHFTGGKAILQSSRHEQRILTIQTGPISLFLSIFAIMDLTHAILTGHQPYFNDTAWKHLLGKEAWWTGLGEYERIFIDTMGTLSRLASLASQMRVRGEVIPVSELLALQLILERLRQSLGHVGSARIGPEAVADSSKLVAFCSTYIMAANIFLYRALGSLGIEHELVQQSVVSGLKASSECQGDSKLIHCVLFPMLVIGSHCISQPEQKAIESALLFCADYLSFGSLKVTLDFLEAKWKNGPSDVDWWTSFEPLATTTFLF